MYIKKNIRISKIHFFIWWKPTVGQVCCKFFSHVYTFCWLLMLLPKYLYQGRHLLLQKIHSRKKSGNPPCAAMLQSNSLGCRKDRSHLTTSTNSEHIQRWLYNKIIHIPQKTLWFREIVWSSVNSKHVCIIVKCCKYKTILKRVTTWANSWRFLWLQNHQTFIGFHGETLTFWGGLSHRAVIYFSRFLKGIVIHDLALLWYSIFMEAVLVDSVQLKTTIHSSKTYTFHLHGIFAHFPWKINQLRQDCNPLGWTTTKMSANPFL